MGKQMKVKTSSTRAKTRNMSAKAKTKTIPTPTPAQAKAKAGHMRTRADTRSNTKSNCALAKLDFVGCRKVIEQTTGAQYKDLHDLLEQRQALFEDTFEALIAIAMSEYHKYYQNDSPSVLAEYQAMEKAEVDRMFDDLLEKWEKFKSHESKVLPNITVDSDSIDNLPQPRINLPIRRFRWNLDVDEICEDIRKVREIISPNHLYLHRRALYILTRACHLAEDIIGFDHKDTSGPEMLTKSLAYIHERNSNQSV